MLTVIVFSKDRPMQLHAYLESLFMFSDISENDVYVLYKKNENIPYQKVIQSFSKVNWIEEINFVSQIGKLLSNSNTYVLFGCDDVVFTDYFKTKDIITFLDKHEEVFGYSIRLGTNFAPVPKDIQKLDGHMIWNWEIT